jgi:signal transduction histidine kinase/CheY-like chemotaxis protein
MRPAWGTVWVAVLLLALHALDIAIWDAHGPGPLFSGLIQLSMGLWTTFAAFRAAKRSGSFGRAFWRLAGAGIALWCVGQILATYFGDIRHIPSLSIPAVNLFIYAWPAPLVMCLFLDPSAETERLDYERTLDFAQVVIVFVLLDIYLSDLPLQGSDRGAVKLAAVTDSLITAGFLARGVSSRESDVRNLFLQFGVFRLVALVTDVWFLIASPNPQRGTWLDLIWTGTWLVPLVAAATWAGGESRGRSKVAEWRERQLHVTQILPLTVPVLVLLMALQVAKTRLALAGTAMLLSLGISYCRLILVQRERRLSYEALREQRNELQRVQSSISDYLWTADVDVRGKFVYRYHSPVVERIACRPPEFYGADPERWLDTVHPEDRQHFRMALNRLTNRSSSAEEEEYRILLPDGQIRFVRDSIRATSLEGESIRLNGIVSDITERKRLEARLREAEKMDAIGRLAGGIAHDFNNLMTIVTGYSILLRDELEDSPPRRDRVDQIYKAAQQANSLTRQLLAFGRRQLLQPRVLNLNEVLEQMEKLLRRLLSEDIELIFVRDQSKHLIRSESGQIEQVIMNLVINARDAMPHGGKLVVSTANVNLDEGYLRGKPRVKPGAYVHLSVSDTGSGIDAETMAHIFEPFFTTKEQGKGTGLGLATVYGIVKQAGGYITVESEPCHGTAFHVYLPWSEGEVTHEIAAAVPKPKRGSSEIILLVEDQEGIRDLISVILRANGYVVLTAQNGQEALCILEKQKQRIDLVVTDVVMPQMSGRALADALSDVRPDAKVLFMSGHVENLDDLISHRHAFIEKPFPPDALLQKVAEILAGHSKTT